MPADVVLLIIALAGILALVFGVAVAGKLSPAGFGDFRRGVGRLWFGPGRLSPAARHVLAVLLVAGEVAVVASLVGGLALALTGRPEPVAVGFAAAAALLGAFTVAQAAALARRRTVPCACFGRSATTVGPLGLLRTVLLLALALTGLVLTPAAPNPIDPAVALLAVPAGVVLGLLLVSLEDLVALFRPHRDRLALPTRPRAGT